MCILRFSRRTWNMKIKTNEFFFFLCVTFRNDDVLMTEKKHISIVSLYFLFTFLPFSYSVYFLEHCNHACRNTGGSCDLIFRFPCSVCYDTYADTILVAVSNWWIRRASWNCNISILRDQSRDLSQCSLPRHQYLWIKRIKFVAWSWWQLSAELIDK